jgi:hypothetical protein
MLPWCRPALAFDPLALDPVGLSHLLWLNRGAGQGTTRHSGAPANTCKSTRTADAPHGRAAQNTFFCTSRSFCLVNGTLRKEGEKRAQRAATRTPRAYEL